MNETKLTVDWCEQQASNRRAWLAQRVDMGALEAELYGREEEVFRLAARTLREDEARRAQAINGIDTIATLEALRGDDWRARALNAEAALVQAHRARDEAQALAARALRLREWLDYTKGRVSDDMLNANDVIDGATSILDGEEP